MANARYALVWPRSLFEWEAKQVVELDDSLLFDATLRLLDEAFQDPSVRSAFEAVADLENARVWGGTAAYAKARHWLLDLARDEKRLIRYTPPRYYAQRGKHTYEPVKGDNVGLAVAFAELLREVQELGYFPVALPRECVDVEVDWVEASRKATRAVHLPFQWEGVPEDARYWEEPLLYSLMEYFHDNAQRPRTYGWMHDYNECGYHFGDHAANSGGVVYRWRVNSLLELYGIDLRLGSAGEERGRLVRHFGTELDRMANARARLGADDPEDEVAHAIRDFRVRGATEVQKRSALALLAGVHESRRSTLKTLLGKDEQDLFVIANKFGIRHRGQKQQTDYGEEFLDYMFTTSLAAITLFETLEKRRGLPSAAD